MSVINDNIIDSLKIDLILCSEFFYATLFLCENYCNQLFNVHFLNFQFKTFN